MLSWRARRQFAAIGAVLFVGAAIVAWFGARFIPSPTCFDNVRNHGEIGVDCGGPCAPCELKNPKALAIFWARTTRAGGNLFDATALVENQNELLASSDIAYEFTLFDELGVVARKAGTAFIYPQERLYIIEPALRTTRLPVKVEFRVTGMTWRLGKESPPQVVVERRMYAVAGEGEKKQGVVEGDILNATSFDFRAFELNVLVFDLAGNLIGANRVAGDNLASGTRMKVKSIWPEALQGTIGKIEVYPRVNLFLPDAIIRPQ